MKAMLEFNLPEEEHDLRIVVQAVECLETINNFREWLRALNKHGHPYTSADEAVGAIYTEYCQRIQDFFV